MHAVQVLERQNNLSEALRKAEREMVVVMNGNHSSAILLNFDEGMLHEPGVSVALATALF